MVCELYLNKTDFLKIAPIISHFQGKNKKKQGGASLVAQW